MSSNLTASANDLARASGLKVRQHQAWLRGWAIEAVSSAYACGVSIISIQGGWGSRRARDTQLSKSSAGSGRLNR